MLDEQEFFGPYGILLALAPSPRSSRFRAGGQDFMVGYLPAESDTGMLGNSNWRGPVWMPVNVLIVRSSSTCTPSTATSSRWSVRPDRARI